MNQNYNIPITRKEMEDFKKDPLRRVMVTGWFSNRKQRKYAFSRQALNPAFGQYVYHWQKVWNKNKERFVQIPHLYPNDYKGGKSQS